MMSKTALVIITMGIIIDRTALTMDRRDLRMGRTALMMAITDHEPYEITEELESASMVET